MKRVRDLPPEWKANLDRWLEVVPHDLPVVFYADDGTDSPDEWEPYPHLAICTGYYVTNGIRRSLAWPVGIDGWHDPRGAGGSWERVAELLAAGRRKPQEDQ